MMKITKQTVLNDFSSENYTVLSIDKSYYWSYSTIYYECPVGHRHKVLYTNWRHKGTRCAVCAGNARKNNVHHIDYNKKNCDQYNLITLCVSCNTRANFDREWHEAWYKTIILNRYKKEEE